MDEMEGQMPDSVEKLMASLPGVGRYTAAAIASIAFQKVCKSLAWQTYLLKTTVKVKSF